MPDVNITIDGKKVTAPAGTQKIVLDPYETILSYPK